MQDHVDRLVDQWQQSMPEINANSMLIFGRMLRTIKQLELMRNEALQPFGFKEGEFDVLATLRRSGQPYQLTPTQLYKSLMVTSGAMTHRLIRLEKAGWIVRVEDQHDKRVSSVRLAAAGLDVIEEAVKIHTEVQEMALSGLEQIEREQLAALLKKLNNQLSVQA